MNQREHQADHRAIAEAIREDWLTHSKLLVHMARAHGLKTPDVTNMGEMMLLAWHDKIHGRHVFADVESCLNKNHKRGLALLRDL